MLNILVQVNLAEEADYAAILADLQQRLDSHLDRAVLSVHRPDDPAGRDNVPTDLQQRLDSHLDMAVLR